jgi:SAM-dependent methyltransferase
MWFSWLMRLASRWHEPLVAERKRALLSQARGNTLEIGPGAGVNFQYLPPDILWTGYEPNRWLARCIPAGPNRKLYVAPYQGQPGEYDTVISTLVLCSVKDPAATLRSLFHSLRPGGQLLFLEHVAAPAGSALRARQDRWQPLWSCCAGGCHPNREAASLLRQAGFAITQLDEFSLPLSLAGPHIAGVALKP